MLADPVENETRIKGDDVRNGVFQWERKGQVAMWLHFMVSQVITIAEVLHLSRLAAMIPSRDLRHQ